MATRQVTRFAAECDLCAYPADPYRQANQKAA